MKKIYKAPAIKVIELSADDALADGTMISQSKDAQKDGDGNYNNDVKEESDFSSSSSTPGSTSIWDEQW